MYQENIGLDPPIRDPLVIGSALGSGGGLESATNLLKRAKQWWLHSNRTGPGRGAALPTPLYPHDCGVVWGGSRLHGAAATIVDLQIISAN